MILKEENPLLQESKEAKQSIRKFVTMKKSFWKLTRPERDVKTKLNSSVWVFSLHSK